jgi:hypothetical protein
MIDLFYTVFCWFWVAFAGAQGIAFLALAGWSVWADTIKPRLIPENDIRRAAEDIIASYPIPNGKPSHAISALGIAVTERNWSIGIGCEKP